MADPINSVTQQAPATPPPRPQRDDSPEQLQPARQQQRAEQKPAEQPREAAQPESRRADADDRLGTRVDTEA